MSNAGILKVSLTAEQAQFISSMKDAASSVGVLTGIVAGATEAIVEFALQMAEKAVEAMVDYVKEADKAIDRAAKLSQAFNVNINTLRQLEYANRLAGGSSEQLDEAMKKLTEHLGEGKADDVLRRMGLNLKELKTQDAGKSFLQIADGIKKMTTTAEQAAALKDIFGKSGVELLPLMNQNLAETSRRFESIAGNLSAIDTANVEIMNQELVDLKTFLEGVATVIISKVAPVVTALGEMFLDTANDGEMIGELVDDGVALLVAGINLGIAAVHGFEAAWYLWRGNALDAILVVIKPLELVGEALDWIQEKVTGVSWGVSAFFDSLRQQAQESYALASQQATIAVDKVTSPTEFDAALEKARRKSADKVTQDASKQHGAFHEAKSEKSSGQGTQHLAQAVTISHLLVEKLKHSGADTGHQQLSEAKKTNQLLTQLLKKSPQPQSFSVG